MNGFDHEDRLVDVLLAEAIGGESCPDLAARVLRATQPVLFRFSVWGPMAGAAAAAMLLLVLQWGRYPEPVAEGVYRTADASAVHRGSLLMTDVQEARLTLGGYGHVRVMPQTAVRIDGDIRDEMIHLERGAVVCDVDSGVGRFSVNSALGRVIVRGTSFRVEIQNDESPNGESGMKRQTMAVSVLSGIVLLSGAFGEVELRAGESRRVESGVIQATVVEKGEDWIVLRAEGQREGVRYVPQWSGGLPKDGGGLDRRMLGAIRETPVGSVIKAKVGHDERPRILAIQIVRRPEAREQEREGERRPEGDKPREGREPVRERERPEAEPKRERREPDERGAEAEKFDRELADFIKRDTDRPKPEQAKGEQDERKHEEARKPEETRKGEEAVQRRIQVLERELEGLRLENRRLRAELEKRSASR